MLEAEPDDAFLNYALALEYAGANDISSAIRLIERILEKDRNYLGAYYQLGKYYELSQQPQKAAQTYKTGVEVAIQRKNRKAQMELNEALLQLEDD